MSILFRWMFYGCLARVTGTMLALLAVFLIIEVFDKSRYLGHGMDASLLVEYLLLKMPFMIAEFMPVILLIATSIYITEISHHHEVVCMRAAGLGIEKIIAPILCVGLIGGGVSLIIGEWIAPATNSRLDVMERVIIHHQKASHQGVQWLKDGLRFYQLTPLDDRSFKMMMLETDNKGAWLKRMDASHAVYKEGQWYLQDVFISSPDVQEGMLLRHEKSVQLASNIGPDTADPPSANHMTFMQLYYYANNLQQAGLDATSFVFTLHRKLAAPATCLIMVLLALSLTMNMGSRIAASSWGIVTAITLGLLFYVFGNASGLLANSGQLPAAYAAWFPMLFFGGLTGFLLLQKEDVH
ncbi:MAG: LptF/LptG family permease [Mariprofundaceae bacterium]|nr:LptF/LptG family permease [Mariprofundaceae bacterium]